MGVINMGVDFGAAKDEAEAALKPVPDGVYELQVTGNEVGKTNAGHARIMWKLSIVNNANSDYNGKNINHFTNIPDDGDMTGVGFLTQFLTAVGCPWEGTDFDPDICNGQIVNANITINGTYNNIESFV